MSQMRPVSGTLPTTSPTRLKRETIFVKTATIGQQILALIVMALPLTACAQQDHGRDHPRPDHPHERDRPQVLGRASAHSGAAPPQTPAASLADFSQLVDVVGPAVVNIDTRLSRKNPAGHSRHNLPDDAQIPDLFRRFFGPDFSLPQTPDSESDGETNAEARASGSGFILSPDGYVLTNHHVVDGASDVTVKLTDRRELKAKVIGSDAQYDVALLKIEAKNLPTVKIGDSDQLRPGQWVVAIGSPFGLDHSVTAGIVSAIGRSNPYANQRYVPFIQTDVAINQGNSGGPLINTRGEVVGINSQIFSASGGYMGISFAIPIDLAIKAAEQIRTTGHVSRGMLGVSIGPIDRLKAQGLKLPDTRGALVNDVAQDSPAAKAGVEVGDVIRAVNGKDVITHSDLPPLVGLLAPGSTVHLSLLRDGQTREVQVTLVPLSEDHDARTSSMPSREHTPISPAVALLGIQVADLANDDRRQLGIERGQGVRITALTAPWARQTEPRLAPGMVILRVGRVPVSRVSDYNQVVSRYHKGDVVLLLVTNGQGTSYVAVKAGGE